MRSYLISYSEVDQTEGQDRIESLQPSHSGFEDENLEEGHDKLDNIFKDRYLNGSLFSGLLFRWSISKPKVDH